jgi:hypothetical protein
VSCSRSFWPAQGAAQPPARATDGDVVEQGDVCDMCGAAELVWRKCKLVCRNCGTILKSCADL